MVSFESKENYDSRDDSTKTKHELDLTQGCSLNQTTT